MNTRLITSSGIMAIAALCAAMCLCGYLWVPQLPATADFGIVLPSPDLWPLSPVWNEVLNAGLIAICAPALYLINKHFSLLKSSLPFWALFYLPLMCANLMLSSHLTAAPVVLATLLPAIVAIFSSSRRRNATRPIFFMATCLAIGSLFQQAFIPFVGAAFLSAIVVKAMRPKEFCAMGLGLIAVYWVLLGFGIVGIYDFHRPHLSTIFTTGVSREMFAVAVWSGVALLTALILSLYNGIKLYAGNSQIRGYNNVVNIFGLTAAVAAMCDIDNMTAYLGVFNIWVALQFANLFTLHTLHRPHWIFWLIQAVILSFAVSLLFTSF